MKYINLIAITVLLLTVATISNAQSSAFTYQGRLTDGGELANGKYDMQLKLYDTALVGTGNQIAFTINASNVTVTDGIFTMLLNFGATPFTGPDRYLEIGIRPAGSADPHTILAPRRLLSSAVYAIRAGTSATSDNATQLGGVAANQFVQTSDSRLTDARTPTAGSANYIQNGTAKQANASFNISGNGIVGGSLHALSFDTSTSYYMAGEPILTTLGVNNMIVGWRAGPDNGLGSDNAFFGPYAGHVNAGTGNSFFGNEAGKASVDGDYNAFFGWHAGNANLGGSYNAFFGSNAGAANTTAVNNAFFGQAAGYKNTQGHDNTFLGNGAGLNNFAANGNTFVGSLAGQGTIGGSNNTFLGLNAGSANVSGADNTIIGTSANVTSSALIFATAIGSGSTVGTSNTIVLGRSNGNDAVQVPGTLTFGVLGVTGNTPLCRNVLNQIANCSSSLRYKTNIQPFAGGLSLLNRLRPITFDWKQGGMHDLGFGAEEIAAIEPLLVSRNDKGEIEGVKYDRISAVLVNAVKEQQTEIEAQRKQIAQQQSELTLQHQQIEELQRLISKNHRSKSTRAR